MNKKQWWKEIWWVYIIIIFILLLILLTSSSEKSFEKETQESSYEKYYLFDKWENDYGIDVRIVKESEVGVVKINLINSPYFNDVLNKTEKETFLVNGDILISNFIELSEKIDAENYSVVYQYHSIELPIFDGPTKTIWTTPKWNIENDLKNKEGLIYWNDFFADVSGEEGHLPSYYFN